MKTVIQISVPLALVFWLCAVVVELWATAVECL